MPQERTPMTLVVLYEELAAYVIASIRKFAEKYNSEIHIFQKKINPVAPFDFNPDEKIKIYERHNFNLSELISVIHDIQPDAILCCGWRYKPYLEIAKIYNPKVPVVLAFDNKWENTLRQNILTLLSRRFFHKRFSYCWVTGRKQMLFASKLHFKQQNIFSGFYSADFDLFHNYFQSVCKEKNNNFPKKFIFVGRYIRSKGVDILWQSFSELQSEQPNDWEMWCMGKGDVQPFSHPKIKHFGFVQSNEMEKLISKTGVFILPSTFEPWGVVIHEFAAAGFPLICSDEVGAAEVFLKDNHNGFIFHSGNKNELKNCMKKIISLSDTQLIEMGIKSIELAKQITPDTWADTLWQIMTND